MRIRAITPIRVSDAELTRRQDRYRRLGGPALEVVLENLPEAGPSALDTADDVAASERLMLTTARATDPDTFDAVVPDCVLDPGVGLADDAPVPLVGILQLAATTLALAGRRFGAVTRNEAIADELRSRVRRYGLDHAFEGVQVLGLDVDAISDDARWHAAVATARRRFVGDRVDVVVNGCSAVDVAGDDADGPPVVDPTRLALALLATVARAGTGSSALVDEAAR